MDPLVMKLEQHHGAHHEEDYESGPWVEIAGDHSSHNLPLQEYNVPLETLYNWSIQHSHSTAQPLQPLVMPQWPSQLTNPSVDNGPPPGFPPPRPLAPISTMPTKPPLPRSASTPAPISAPSTARRTLTDQDKRLMCQYHEDHPTVKQTEIGTMFGVERSTVSKVLRQKEKHLYPDGSRSPIKRSKGKFRMHQQTSQQQINSPAQTNSPVTMASPPNPTSSSSVSPRIGTSNSNASSLSAPPSQDEARRALEILMNFFLHQPNGAVDPQEYITMGKLMEKLKLQGTGLPGGMHSLERGGGTAPVGRKRSIHSL